MSSPPPPRANGVVTVTVNGCGIGVQQPVDTPGGPVHSKGGPLSPAAVSNTELRRRLDLLRRWFADFDDAQRTMAVQAIQVGNVIIYCLMLLIFFFSSLPSRTLARPSSTPCPWACPPPTCTPCARPGAPTSSAWSPWTWHSTSPPTWTLPRCAAPPRSAATGGTCSARTASGGGSPFCLPGDSLRRSPPSRLNGESPPTPR